MASFFVFGLCLNGMSETEWSLVPECAGRVTSKKLGENSETAVIRWNSPSGAKYRVIRVVDSLPPVSLLWIFGCDSPVVLMSRMGNDVLVNYKGLSLTVKSWVLRSERTVPPDGPRPRGCEAVDPVRAGRWTLVKPVGTRCVVLHRRRRRTEYRGVYWQSPAPGPVLIQGVDVVWEFRGGVCVHGKTEMRVHRSCLIGV